MEVTGEPYFEPASFWSRGSYPYRVPIKVLHISNDGVAVEPLRGELAHLGRFEHWSHGLMGAPRTWPSADAEKVAALLADTKQLELVEPNPALLPDTALESDGARGTVVASACTPQLEVVAHEETASVGAPGCANAPLSHHQMQALIADIAAAMGYQVWVPRSDQRAVSSLMQRADYLRNDLPFSFPATAQRVIEHIDVLWLSDSGTVVNAFEVEHTTSVASGLARFEDLLSVLPHVKTFIVADEARSAKVARELGRPGLSGRLVASCGFLTYESVIHLVARDDLAHLRPSILDMYANSHEATLACA